MNFDLLVVANPVWETTWLVDAIPREGPATAVPIPGLQPANEDGGGSSLNTACALAAAGRRVLAVGQIGDDAAGHAALEALYKRGVETRIRILPGRATKRNYLYVERATAATAFQVFLPPLSVPAWEEEPSGLLEARVLWLDRLATASPQWLRLRRERIRAFNGLNRNSGVGTAAAGERFWRALPFVDLLQIPEAEAGAGKNSSSAVSRATDPDMPVSAIDAPFPALDPPFRAHNAPSSATGAPASIPAGPSAGDDRTRIHRPAPLAPMVESEEHRLLQAGVRILVRTRGPRGVALRVRAEDAPDSGFERRGQADAAGQEGWRPSAGERGVESDFWEIPALATEVADPTGAGDAFAAGFLDGWLEGMSPAEAARQGVDWAARACRHLGARGWLDQEPPRPRSAGG